MCRLEPSPLAPWKCAEPFESEAHAKHWLIRVALNLCKNVFRAPWRKLMPLDELDTAAVFDTPEQGALYAEVMALPEKYRKRIKSKTPTISISRLVREKILAFGFGFCNNDFNHTNRIQTFYGTALRYNQ